MKNARPRTPRPSSEAKRQFRWGIQSTDISFVAVNPAEAAIDGSSNDCGCSIARFDAPRKKKPAQRSGE